MTKERHHSPVATTAAGSRPILMGPTRWEAFVGRNPIGAGEPSFLTDAQRRARLEFDLDAAMAALPAPRPSTDVSRPMGAAGVRLRSQHVARISDALLRDFAKDALRAARVSTKYLDALRVVLGNQADAERTGLPLEMNLRVEFASVGVMRTIVGQMRDARITRSKKVALGSSKSQVVQCYRSRRRRPVLRGSAADQLLTLERWAEQAHPPTAPESRSFPFGISAAEVPH